MIKFIIVIALAGLVAGFIKTDALGRQINRRLGIRLSEPMVFSGCVLAVFLLFTTVGLTGSSLNLGLRQTSFVEAHMKRVWGHEQAIRSDEWLVLTPMAIAQYNHEPRFPVVNRNRGPDGHNMLIAGMAGVPVAHVSALAKPATWGFFIFDLKRALAWYWWFPVAGCFLALAHVLHALAPGRWRQSFLFSLLFVATPYVVAWSFWPAYTVFFPCVALLCVLRILQRRKTLALLPLGILAGLAVAGFVFILYPPWQVTVGYAFIALLVGVVLRDRLYRGIALENALALLVAILVAAILVGSWWLSAREAIEAMMHTVYPGQRSEAGGNMPWHFLFAGYTNLTTLQFDQSRPVNQSEIASFQYYFLPLAVLFLMRARQRVLTAVEIALAVMIVFTLAYILLGVGQRLSTLSLWSYATAKRADLALGLACLILTHQLSGGNRNDTVAEREVFGAALVALVWAAIVYTGIRAFDGPQLSGSSISIILTIVFAVAAGSYLLVTRQTLAFLGLNLGLTVAMTASFHPIYIAPKSIRSTVAYDGTPVLITGSRIPAMMLAASGQPVFNGVFYYPQPTFWSRLDPEGRYVQSHNRYQHLMFISRPDVEVMEITVPWPDVVMVLFNPERMDFSKTGAGLVVSPEGEGALLQHNPTLTLLRSENGWTWFKVATTP